MCKSQHEQPLHFKRHCRQNAPTQVSTTDLALHKLRTKKENAVMNIAISNLKPAEHLKGDTVEAEWFREEGDALCKDNRFRAAVEQYSHAIDLKPFSAPYHVLRAAAFASLKQFAQAASDAYV